MTFKHTIAIFIFLLTIFTFSASKKVNAFAEIGTGYLSANYNSLVTTFLLSLPDDEREPRYIDGYSRLFECPLVMEHYNNEFEWQKIRDIINTKIDRLDREYFSYYEFGGSVELEQYNFDKQAFPVNRRSELIGVRLFNVFRYSTETQRGAKNCAQAFTKHEQFISYHIPSIFSVKILSPITFKELPMEPQKAKAFAQYAEKNTKKQTRKIYIRFRIKLDSLADIRKWGGQEEAIFHGELYSADIFLDKNFTRYVDSLKL